LGAFNLTDDNKEDCIEESMDEKLSCRVVDGVYVVVGWCLVALDELLGPSGIPCG